MEQLRIGDLVRITKIPNSTTRAARKDLKLGGVCKITYIDRMKPYLRAELAELGSDITWDKYLITLDNGYWLTETCLETVFMGL